MAKKMATREAYAQTLGELGNRVRLVAAGLVLGLQPEDAHVLRQSYNTGRAGQVNSGRGAYSTETNPSRRSTTSRSPRKKSNPRTPSTPAVGGMVWHSMGNLSFSSSSA